MRSAIVLLNYPLQNQIDVGHLDLLQIQFENMLNLFDKVHVISPRDNRKYNLNWDSQIIIHTTGCATNRSYYASPLSDLRCILKLIKTENIAVIRALAHSSGFIAVLASKITGIPTVVSIHCDRKLVAEKEGESKFKHWLLGLTDAWTYKNAAIVPVISKYIDNCVKKVCPEANTFLHYNFVDATRFKPRKSRNKIPVLVFAGRLVKVNGVDILLQSLPAVLAEKKVVLKVLGDGPERRNLEKLAINLGVSKHVRFLGRVNHDRSLPRELGKSDIFVSPALSGFSLMEAIACGLPIVGADVEWTKEIVNNMVGVLVEYGSAGAFTKGISKVIGKNLGKNARKLAVERFNIKAWRKRELEIYNGLPNRN